MAKILALEFFGRPMASYAIIAGIWALVLSLGLISLRVVGRRRRKSGGPGSRREDTLDMTVRRFVMPALYVGAAAASVSIMNIGDTARIVAEKVIIGLSVFFGARLVVSIIGRRLGKPSAVDQHADRAARIRPLLGVIKAIVWLSAALVYLENLGIRMSSILAGLGIGGIAIALAAQSILGDLFSYFIIFFDKPFAEGDFVAVDEISGAIDHVGIKTTRIRALSGEQVVIANSVMTGSRIRNFGRMERRRVVFTVSVVLETERAVAESIPSILRAAIEDNPSTEFDRAHLKCIGPSSLEYECVYYLPDPDYLAYMDAQQAVLLEVIEEFAARRISLAYPTTTVYCSSDRGAAKPAARRNS